MNIRVNWSRVEVRMREASLIEPSLLVYAINVAGNEMNDRKRIAMRARTHGRRVVNDLIYVRIVRIRPLGHHGPSKVYL
jgi:hypothetical protein